jgi:hypothetical protein
MKKGKSPTERNLPIEIDAQPAEEKLTGLAGIPLLVQAFRSLGLAVSIRRHLKIKKRERGFDEATMVESFVILNAAGGECLDDFDHLREDQGLSEMIGHEIPSSSASRQFLYQFHEEEKIENAKQQRLPDEVAYIPEEGVALSGLGEVNVDLIKEIGRRCPDQKIATVDEDATLMESRKREALRTYEGYRGYQPMLAVWAETGLILADQFRDGNVPSMMDPLRVARRAFDALPEGVESYFYRGDSACHEEELIKWLRDEEREGKVQGFIGFGISARMTKPLREAIEALPENAWEDYSKDDREERQCADVVFVSNADGRSKDGKPLRYVAIRIRKRQGELFGDGNSVKHHAVVSNIWDWRPKRLIEWHREKCGTIEMVHDVVKNELAGGVMPCGRFGANAAWLRLTVITHNLLTGLKRLALPPEMLNARPKRMRFLIFNTAGRILNHARKKVLRVAICEERIRAWIEAIKMLPAAPQITS